MVVISYRVIREYKGKHADSGEALDNWYTIMEEGGFANLSELRSVFNTVDYVGNDRYVFNIKGNKYRVIALIHFEVRTVYILFIGTHAQYDKINASTIKFRK